MNIFVFGSSILSSYWNGAATYYRGIYKSLAQRGHAITFAEPDAYGRQRHLDRGDFSFVHSIVYTPSRPIEELLHAASDADVVIKHSGVGVDDALLEQRLIELHPASAVVFWDVDAPATMSRVRSDAGDPFRSLIPAYDAIITYGGGPVIERFYRSLGANRYASVYNGLDPESHHPVTPREELLCDVAFLGNRLPDREARVDDLFLRAAAVAPEKQFLLGGEGWGDKALPANVRWIGHVPTDLHNAVNCSAGMVMNINRSSMAEAGFSPPTRVFEVAGSGSCLLCDQWDGIETFFEIGNEILVINSAEDVVHALRDTSEQERRQIGAALRKRALREHTYEQRAIAAEQILQQCLTAGTEHSERVTDGRLVEERA